MSDPGDNKAVGNVGGEGGGGGVQVSGQVGNPPERPKLPGSFISASIISTLLLSGLLLIKVYGVAHYNVNVAVALASASPTSVILGTIAVYSYFFIGMIATASICLFIYGSTHVGQNYMYLRPIFFLIALFMFLLTPWHYFVDGIVLTALLTVTQRLFVYIWGNQSGRLLISGVSVLASSL